MKMHKILTALLAGLCIFAYTAEVQAADLVTVIVADTKDREIGDSSEADFKNMRKRMQEVAYHTGLNLREMNFKGDAMIGEKVMKGLRDIKVNRDDVVLFYYSGHGYRPRSKTSPWPNLWFSQEDTGLEFDVVMETLEGKGPRLFIAMADACNNKIPDKYSPPLVARFAILAREDQIRENYRHLFLNKNGVIKIASSEVGEYAWGTDTGGIFTNAFLEMLQKTAAGSETPDWGTILDGAAFKVKDDQHPTYIIDLRNN